MPSESCRRRNEMLAESDELDANLALYSIEIEIETRSSVECYGPHWYENFNNESIQSRTPQKSF